MKLSDDVAPKRKSSVSTLLPIFGMCPLAALTLAGCQGMPEAVDSLKISLAANFAIGESAGLRGCTKEALVRALQVDGEVGLSEQQVNASGLHLCKVPWGADSRCVAPLPHVYTEVDVICPFLFNVWELPKDLYGYGESRWLRQKMIAKCKYNDDPRVAAKWCFTDWCVDKPLTCFSSQKAAEAAKPWEKTGARANHTDKNEVKFPPLSVQAGLNGVKFPPLSVQATTYKVGDHVEGLWGPAYHVQNWYKATIEEANADGTYTLRWDDGDTRDKVKPAAKIRLQQATMYKVGDHVEGLYKSGTWYKATIEEANVDGTYTCRWDDGDYQGKVVQLNRTKIRLHQAQDDSKTSSPSAANKEAEASPVPAGHGKLVPSGHQDEVSDDVSDVEEKIPRRNLVPDTDKSSGASAAQVGDAESSARHQRKGARRSSIQVLQGAHLMHDRGSERV